MDDKNTNTPVENIEETVVEETETKKENPVVGFIKRNWKVVAVGAAAAVAGGLTGKGLAKRGKKEQTTDDPYMVIEDYDGTNYGVDGIGNTSEE